MSEPKPTVTVTEKDCERAFTFLRDWGLIPLHAINKPDAAPIAPLAALLAEAREKAQHLGTPCAGPDSCPTWYDFCRCTVETLRHNIERAERAEALLVRVLPWTSHHYLCAAKLAGSACDCGLREILQEVNTAARPADGDAKNPPREFRITTYDTGDFNELVITKPASVHFEMLDSRTMWFGIYLNADDDARVAGVVTMKRGRAGLTVTVTERPDDDAGEGGGR